MFARAKILLHDIPPDLLQAATDTGAQLTCTLEATNDAGQPASGSIRPPQLSWHIET